MNRQRMYLIGVVWLMLVLLFGCTPTPSEVEPAANLPQEGAAADGAALATAVSTPTAIPTTPPEESVMNDDVEGETPATAVPQETNTPQPEKLTLQETPILPQEEPAFAKPTIPVPEDPTIQEQVNKAKEDLAARLGFAAALIELVDYQTMTWRDGSLGCPQPGMAYTQALVEGYRIQLQIDGVQYNYHGAAGRDPFFCAGPNAKIAPLSTVPAPGQMEK